MKARLEDVPNIGKVLADRLRRAGIETPAALLQLGDDIAFARIKAELPDDACTHTRLALAGAVRGVRWHALAPDLRAELTKGLTR